MKNTIKGLGLALLAVSLFACSGEVGGDDGTATGQALEGQQKSGAPDGQNTGGPADTGNGGGQDGQTKTGPADTGNGGGGDGQKSGGAGDTGSGGGSESGTKGGG